VQENRNIPLPTRCLHPLAVLSLSPAIKIPIWKNANYVSPKDHQFVSDKVKQMLADQVVEKAPEECLNSFALVVVPKKDAYGRKIDRRLCIDLRPLNPRLTDIDYPLPNIKEILDSVGSFTGTDAVYSTIDIRDGYHRFNVEPADRNWLAFRWNRVHYRFTCALFGIKAMTALFQRVMDKIFRDLPFVAVYVDDITVFVTKEHMLITLLKLSGV